MAKATTGNDLPLPWIDNPIPSSKIQPDVKIQLRTRDILFGPGYKRDVWPPVGYPYRPIIVTTYSSSSGPDIVLKSPYGTLHYFEILGQGDPPSDIGYPGDLYVDLTPRKHRIHYRDRTRWRRYSPPTLAEEPRADGRVGWIPTYVKVTATCTRHPFADEFCVWIDREGIGWSESNNWSLLETLWRQRFNARRVTDEHAALTRVRDLQDDYANRKRDLALDSASAAQSSTPFKKRKITLDSDESSSEDGDGASSTQNDEDASVDAPEPDAAPEETHHDILDDNNEEESAPPSTDITSEQKPEVCMDKKPTNMGAAADTVISSEDILVEHISNVLGSLKAAREAQKAAVRERDEAKSAREAEARRLSDAVRERDEITRERDKAIRKLETQLKASEDEKTRLSASLKIADKARLAAEKKYAALKDTLAGVLAASE